MAQRPNDLQSNSSYYSQPLRHSTHIFLQPIQVDSYPKDKAFNSLQHLQQSHLNDRVLLQENDNLQPVTPFLLLNRQSTHPSHKIQSTQITASTKKEPYSSTRSSNSSPHKSSASLNTSTGISTDAFPPVSGSVSQPLQNEDSVNSVQQADYELDENELIERRCAYVRRCYNCFNPWTGAESAICHSCMFSFKCLYCLSCFNNLLYILGTPKPITIPWPWVIRTRQLRQAQIARANHLRSITRS